MNAIYTELLESFRQGKVIDTHEHLEDDDKISVTNFLQDYLCNYFCSDLQSSGMPQKTLARVQENSLPLIEQWRLVEPYWERCRLTGYGRMLDYAAQQLYGVDRVDEPNLDRINEAYLRKRAMPRYGTQMLSEAGIRHCVDNIWHLKNDDRNGFFYFTAQLDEWIAPHPDFVRKIGAKNLDAWIDAALTRMNGDFGLRGAKALKLGLAYLRPVCFQPDVSKEQAAALYLRYANGEILEMDPALYPMQDYLAHMLFRWADEHERVLQIHLGYQTGNSNLLSRADPSQINDLLIRYPHIRFDLFHAGYPYQHLFGALGKMFPNAYLNLCWTHILAPVVARRILCEWLTEAPSNKIFAFGGDCLFYDGAIGHLEMARRNVAHALAELCEDGFLTVKQAEKLGHQLFYDNPREFYGMPVD